MKERPIFFSAPMVCAILEGRKTQTRRVIKPQPYIDKNGNFEWNGCNYGQDFNGPRAQAIASPIPSSKTKRVLCPYGKPGDRLWVRETWRKGWTYGGDYPTAEYLADNAAHIGWEQRPVMAVPHQPYPASHGGKWKPSIHMPRWASRILLEVVSVRVERLRDISEADALEEGADYLKLSSNGLDPEKARRWFRDLWMSINGINSWNANPWVWVVEFRRVTP